MDKIKKASQAGITLLNLGSTLVPGSLRHDLALLEGFLQAVLDGRLLVVAPPATVESAQPAPTETPEEDPCAN